MSKDSCSYVIAGWLRDLASRNADGVPLEAFLGAIDVGVLSGYSEYLLRPSDVRALADLIDSDGSAS